MRGVIDPDWTFEEAVDAASHWYRPGSRLTGPARNAAIEAWASATGRNRALAELRRVLGAHGTVRAACRALSMSPKTWKRFEASFAAMPERPVPRGVTLTFDTRLHRFDPTAFDVLISEVLGPDTDVTIEERSGIGREGPATLRLSGARPEDLLAVVEAFYERAWRAREEQALQSMASGLAVVLARLEAQRDHLVRIDETLGILRDPDLAEMWSDQAHSFVLDKDRKLLQTRFQKLGEGLANEVKRRLGKEILDVVQGEVEEGAGYLVREDRGPS